ncbi:hypothetical protein D3C85_956600 [compost metagenome]
MVGGDRQLLVDLLAADHRDLLRRLARFAPCAGGTDGQSVQLYGLLGQGRQARHGQASQ